MPCRRDRRSVQVLADDRDRFVADEWWSPADHLVKHGTKRVEVGLRTYCAAQGLFRRHVAHGANHHPCLGEPAAVNGNGETEVTDIGNTGSRQPDVSGLEVAVDDPFL